MWLKINADDVKPLFEFLDLHDSHCPEFGVELYAALDCDECDILPTVVSGIFLFVDKCAQEEENSKKMINVVASRLVHCNPIVGDVLVGELHHRGQYLEMHVCPCTEEKYQWLIEKLR